MKKNTFKKALSIATAALMGIMSIPVFPSSANAAEVYTMPSEIYGLSTTTATQEAITTGITNGGKIDDLTCTPAHSEAVVGDTLEIKVSWPSGESYDGAELEIQDTTPGCIDIAASDSPDTLLVTAVRTGYTTVFVRTPDGEAGFFTVDVGTGDITSTVEAYIGMSFGTSAPVLALGETITIDMFYRVGDSPYTGAFPEYTMYTPGIVSIAPGETESTLEMTALAVGTTSIRFFPGVGYADMFVTVTEDGAVTTTPTTTTINTNEGRLDDMLCTPQYNEMLLGESSELKITWNSGESYDRSDLEFEFAGYDGVEISETDSPDTYLLTAIKTGHTTVIFRNSDGDAGFFTVTVTEPETTTVTTTTTIVACYATQVEYDNSDAAVGDTVAVRFWNPATGTAANAQFMEVSDNISYEYEEGSDTVYITALEPGEAKMYILAEGCAFGAYVTFTVTEDGAVTTTTTTTDTAYPYTTTTDYGIQLACSEENVTLYPGHAQSFYLYYKTGPTSFSYSYPVTFEIEDETVARIYPEENAGAGNYVIEALAEGTTKVTIKQQYGNDTLTCEMNVTVAAQTTTTAPVTDVPGKTTYITTAAPALVCSPSAVTVEAGKRQPIIMSFASGRKISEAPTGYESDNEAVAAAEQGEYSYICYIEGVSEGTANITITPPYGYDPVTIPVTVVPADDDDSNDASVHIVVEEKFYDMIPKGGSLDLSDSSYSVYKHDGTSSRMEKVLSKVSMSAETENVTVDASAFDSTTPGYYDITITYTDDDGYTDTVTLCAAVYYFEGMDTTTTTTATTTTTRITTSGIELNRTELTVPVGVSDYVIIRSATGGVYPRFEIEDESIAEVIPDEDSFCFYVKGLAEGTTTIKVIDGENHSEVVNVTVVPLTTTTTIATTTTIVGTHTGEAADGTTVNLTTAIGETTTTTAMGIVLSDSEIKLEAGQRVGIGISKTDGSDYFDGYFVECTSDNPAVAVVQTSDIPYTIYVVGMAEGTANITVYDPAFGSTANLQVTVTGTADNTIGKDVSIVIDSLPDKLQYNIGEELDLTGGVYRVVNDSTGDNVYGPWDIIAGRIITAAFDSTTAGTYPIYISYNNPIYGYWDVYVFYVTVNDPNAVTPGDIDNSGEINLDDATAALTYYARIAAGIDAEIVVARADVDGNGEVDLDDAAYILSYYARNAAGLPCTWDDIII